MKKKIGILGGTFNPPHIGHLIIADQVLHSFQLDEIWFMPNHLPPHKQLNIRIANEDRQKMIELAIDNCSYFKIETIEIERLGKSYTYDTMLLLKEREPNVEFYFIIGGDMVEYLPKWYNIDQLIKLVQFIGVNRPHYSLQTTYPIKTVEIPSIDISSSIIRDKLKKGESINYYLPDKVIQFIREKGLYGCKSSN
ncbi:nicotinate-nucleotide adenylyltransferase [Bacillus kwashiorkori]|uniref:nicotinate-nucleotide adenylyltransferase n=1 Tax=Bacillus kwashiorkori TaxID=1522318 RepID=UPI000785E8CD|nr:nicotinate-nucleotide adenylyltransferase [Bacillus kwashiorkori]